MYGDRQVECRQVEIKRCSERDKGHRRFKARMGLGAETGERERERAYSRSQQAVF